jgi:hypothetical protein
MHERHHSNYDEHSYVPGSNFKENQLILGGIGYGLNPGSGVGVPIAGKFSIEVGNIRPHIEDNGNR